MTLSHLETSTHQASGKRLFSPAKVAALLVLLLVLAEVGLQLFGDAAPGKVNAGEVLNLKGGRYELKKSASFTSGNKEIQINAQGMRGQEPDKNLLRIGLVGGDAVFGSRIADENKTLNNSIERHLTVGNQRRFQFLNAGVPRLNLAHAKERIEESLIPSGVKAIILFIGIEDIIGLMKENASLPEPTVEESSFMDKIALWRMISGANDKTLTSHSGVTESVQDEQIAAMKQRLLKHVLAVFKLCQANNIGLMLVSEPNAAYSISPKLEDERKALADQVGVSPSGLRRLCNDVSVLLSLWESRENVWYYNLADAFYSSRDADALEEYHYGPFDPMLGAGLQQAGTDRASKLLSEYLRSNPPWILRPSRKP